MEENIIPAAAAGEVIEQIGRPASTTEIAAFMSRLAVPSPAVSDEDRVDRISVLEALKAAAAAAQAHDMVAFADSQREDQASRGMPARDRGTGIAAQLGLACRVSPHRGGRMLSTARALLTDLPWTLEALTRGETSEYRAGIVAKETAVLDPADRRRVDAELGPRLHELGDRRVEGEARGWACRLDPAAMVKRASKAHSERRVTCRPAPDTMTYLTGLLPVRDGVSVYAALDAAAKAAAAAGDTRTRGQVMADTLVARVTSTAAGALPVEIQLILTDRALLTGGAEPAHVHGYGPVPAEVARQWILSLLDPDEDSDPVGCDDTRGDGEGEVGRRRRAKAREGRHDRGRVWLRRLYTTPDGRHLVAMDSHRRRFPGLLRRLIEYRDRICATPYCGAPIRHVDHTEPVRRKGATSYLNGRGTCAACNHAKEAPGWQATVTDTTTTAPWSAPSLGTSTPPADPHVQASAPERIVTLTTPTGHTYTSRPPPAHHDTRAPDESPAAPAATQPRAG